MRKNVYKILFIGLTIIWMGIIFYFSSQTGTQSSSMSGKITDRILHFFVPTFDNLSSEEQIELFNNTSFVIRKLAHYFEYAVLGLFLYLTFYNFMNKKIIVFPLALGVGILYAISDEIHQSFIGGRSPMVWDVVIDSCGILTMLLGIEIILTLKNVFKKR